MIGDQKENKIMITQKIDEATLSPSMFNDKKVFKSRISDDELVINPKNVFYTEEPQKEKAPVIKTLPPTRKKYKKRTKEGETNFKLHTDPVNRTCSNQMFNPSFYDHYNQRPRVNSAEPYSRSPLYMPVINPLHAHKFQAHYHHAIPHSSTLFRPQERKNLKINQDPFFFRIPQPMNNSLILNINNINHDLRFNNNELRFNINNDMRFTNQDKFLIHPHGFIPHNDLRLITPINYAPVFKTIFRLKVDAQRLYDFDYIDIQEDKTPDLSSMNVSDGLFATYLNKFNKKYGITQLSVKYAVVMGFLYCEIQKQKGYWSVKPGEWRNLSTMIKDFVRIKEIYLFLVYPFEQFLLGHKKVVRYKDEGFLQKYASDFLIYSAQDINFYLKKGSLEEMKMMLDQIDIKKMKKDGFIQITTFLCDIYHTSISDHIKDCKKYSEDSTQRGKMDIEYYKKISSLSQETAINYIRKCLEIAIQFGIFTNKCYKRIDIGQQFINRIYFCVLNCKKANLISWNEFYEYTNNCFRNFYPGTDEIYLNLYKSIKTNPLLVIRTLSNIQFSKNKTKKMLRSLAVYIKGSIESAMRLLDMKSPINDEKALEYIISSFYVLKGFRKVVTHVLIIILEYYVYLYHNGIYQKSKNGSDLFKIITRLMIFEDVSREIHSKRELIEEVKKIPGLRELI
ncbi:hypothetical protein NBO_4g0048 [Nosema bombycis CQ1]|uniref:Uncharacterized protein n=1 Tax=Nosema bombycis (strain CQ1 / CVCC 102059) TaxID=578461 RepID=R0MMJ4_NOSB1|nr:hypothetical protein NBO_4g0048 [Nosema bombycis CQ1]|eukprot:EOB15420.1 hypothetical protein NBO_4g0048 [Nosema bombycis CQ1]